MKIKYVDIPLKAVGAPAGVNIVVELRSYGSTWATGSLIGVSTYVGSISASSLTTSIQWKRFTLDIPFTVAATGYYKVLVRLDNDVYVGGKVDESGSTYIKDNSTNSPSLRRTRNSSDVAINEYAGWAGGAGAFPDEISFTVSSSESRYVYFPAIAPGETPPAYDSDYGLLHPCSGTISVGLVNGLGDDYYYRFNATLNAWTLSSEAQCGYKFFDEEGSLIHESTALTGSTRVFNSTGAAFWISSYVALPPAKAINPTPADGTMNVDVSQGLTLSWEPGDWGNLPDSYDIYLDDELLESGYTAREYEHDGAGLSIGSGNMWRVDSVYGSGTVVGDEWEFGISVAFGWTTPVNEFPADAAIGVARNIALTWTGGDKMGSFGPPISFIVVLNGVRHAAGTSKSFTCTNLGYGQTYTWSVIAYAGSVEMGYSESTPTTFTTSELAESPVGGADGTRTKRLVAAADDKIWIEEL